MSMRNNHPNFFVRHLGGSGILAFTLASLALMLFCIWTVYRLFSGQVQGGGWWLLVGTSWTFSSLAAAVPAGAMLYREPLDF